MKLVNLLCLTTLLLAGTTTSAAQYDVDYEVTVDPEEGLASVTLTLEGESLPSKLELHINEDRHLNFSSEQKLDTDGDKVVWRPREPRSTLQYDFVIDRRKNNTSYDSMITDEWAVLRSDKLIPPIAATAKRGLDSRAVMDFDLPDGWSSAAPYEKTDAGGNRFRITDPGRSFVRPKGWLILGAVSSRQDIIADTEVRIAAPRGQGVRLQDSLAFINWTLPELKKIFPEFPPYILIVSAGNPMWRGGLSAPNSLFMHSDRPLISGNRTSSLIHELVHIGTSIHGTDQSDWIVEGIAEYYAVEILRRTGGISEVRYQQTMEELADWAEQSDGLFTGRSSGATTARAVGLMHRVDLEIKERSKGKNSLDNVATALAKDGGTVTVKDFIELAEQYAGGELSALEGIRQRIED